MRRRNQRPTLNQKSSRPDAQTCQSHTELYSSTQSQEDLTPPTISFTGPLPPSFRNLLNKTRVWGTLICDSRSAHTCIQSSMCCHTIFFFFLYWQYSVLNMAALCPSFPIWLCCNVTWSPVRGSMYLFLLSPMSLIGYWAVAHDSVRCAYWLIAGHLALQLHSNYVPFVPSQPLIIVHSS